MSAEELQGKKCTCGSAMNDKSGCLTCGADYGTTKQGQVKFDLGSKQDRYLHFKDIDHSHVHVDDEGNKSITRHGENYPENK